MSEQLPPGGIELSPADIEALGGRWSTSWTPSAIAHRLAGLAMPWYVAAGWALDLFRGYQTRAHGDLEIGVPIARFPEIRERFSEYAVDAVSSGRIWENATPEVLAVTHQSWVRDPGTNDYLVDVFREPHDGDTWICRHDETIRLPYDDIICFSPAGIPYLAPELVLLFKAKHARPKDQADFEATIPHLSPAQRAALAELLARVHPGHRWLTAVGS